MNHIADDRLRLAQADNLPEILDALWRTFGDVLAVLRHHQGLAGHGFPAFVLAAGAAANGRDWITDAPSLPPAAAPPCQPAGNELLVGRHWSEVAAEVASTATVLARTLAGAAARATDEQDRACCEHAATYAARITELLGGARQP